MKSHFKNYLFLLVTAGIIIALDQFTKELVRNNLAYQEVWAPWPWLLPYARIVHWQNQGAAFGMLQGLGGVFTILAFVVSIAILYFYPQVPRSDRLLRLALGLQLGGAVGNLIDRLTQKGLVTDFVSVGSFPVFNVADASISIGVAILILDMWFKERGQKESSPGREGASGPEQNPREDSVP